MSAKSTSPSSGPGAWIPLMDYAMRKGVSLSTLRRHIKSNKIRFMTEHGRYLIWDVEGASPVAPSPSPFWKAPQASNDTYRAESRENLKIEELEMKLRRAQEEVAELKMLVSLYEEQLFQKPSPQL